MNFLKRLPIGTQLLILAVATTVVMIFIIFLTYYQISKSITKKNSEYTIDIITQVKQSVSINCDIINRIITNIAYNPTIQDFLMETDDEVTKLELFKKVDKLLINMAGMKDGILDILVIGDNGNYDSLTGKTSFVNEMKDFPQRAKPYYSGIKVFEKDNYKRYCFIVGTIIYSADPQKMPGNKIGALAMIMDIKAIGPEIAILSKTSATKFYLLDRNDKVFSSNEALELGRKFDVINDSTKDMRQPVVKLIKGKKNIVLKEELMDIGGKVISIVPEKELFSDLLEIRRIVISIFFITIVLLSIPFMFIINNILQPLKKLMSFMNKVKSGNLKNRIHLEGYAEMSIMAQEFNSMLDEIDTLTHRLIDTNSKLYQSELGKKQSELAFLQSQINPHFLYNTLESIKGIAAVRGVIEIKDIAKALGRIFRYSIKGADMVSLQEELDIVKSYLQIQQIRFKDRFNVKYDFSKLAFECKVPKMILQPLVENAVFHGLEPKMGTGNLYISGKVEETQELIICIKDDGVGIDDFTIENINSGLLGKIQIDTFEDNSRIGVVNVHNRLKLTFGENYGLIIKSEYEKGTEVILRIPARREINV